MNAPLRSDVLTRLDPTPQYDLQLAAKGVQRYVWESRYGPMLIEVRDDQVFVNGARIESADAAAQLKPGVL